MFIQPLFTDNHQQTADVCYEILVAVCARTNKGSKQGRIYESMCLHLKPEASRLLKIRVIADSPFGHGRIHALQRSDYPAVSPFIICDQMLNDRTSTDAIKAFVNDPTKVSKSDVERVVTFIADNHDNPGAVFEKLSSIDIFHNLELQQVNGMLTLKRVRQFAILIRNLAHVPLPPSMKKVAVKHCLQPMVDAFQRQEMEIDDLYSYIRELISFDDESLFTYVLDYLERCCPSAAKYMASSAGLQPRCLDAPDAATQCARPFSEDQHIRHSPTEIVLRGVSNFGAFRQHLSLSPTGFLIDFHDAPPTLDKDGGISLIVFGFTGATVFFNPKVAPELTKKIGLLLRNYSGFVMSYSWPNHGHIIQNLFHWRPRRVIDLKKLAEDKGLDSSLDSFARIVSNAPLCLRGSKFGSAAFPSPVARRHMAIRVQILYDIGLHLHVFGPPPRSRPSDPSHERRSPDRHKNRREDRRENRRGDYREDRHDRDRSDNRDDRRRRR